MKTENNIFEAGFVYRNKATVFLDLNSLIKRAGIIVLVMLAISNVAFTKTTTWIPTNGGLWTTVGNWNNGVPVANDDVIINSTQSANITAVPTIVLNSLTISGNCTFAGSGAPSLLTISTTFSVSSGIVFICGIGANGTRVNITLSNTCDGTINGTVRLNTGSTNEVFTNSGNLTIAQNGVIDDITDLATFILSSGATLQIGSTAGITNVGSATGNIQVDGVRTYTAGANYVYNGTANQTTGTGLTANTPANITIDNPGNTVTLTANTNLTGILTVNSGSTLALTTYTLGATNAPTSTVLYCGATTGSVVSGTGILTLGGNVTVTDDVTAGNSGATISCPVALGATRTFTVADDGTTATDLTISGIISGAAGITKAGAGTLALSVANTYTGAVTINAGILSANTLANAGAGNTSSLGTGAVTAAISISGSGTLQYTGSGHSTNRQITLTGSGGTIDASGSSLMTLSGGITGNSNNLVLSGTGTGLESGVIATTSGNVTKNGTGTWTLSGTNTYTGATIVNGGTLKAGVATQAFGVTSAVTMANTSGVILDITGFNNAIGSLTGGGTNGGNITLGAATLTIGSDNTSPATYGGIISGTGSISKTGTGTLTLSGANTYTGGLTITGGIVQLGATNVLSNSLPVVINGGSFSTGSVSGYSEITGTLSITDNSTLSLGTGSHSLIFSDSHLTGWTANKFLTITGWQGSYGASGTAGQFFVGSGATGLTTTQLAQIRFLIGTDYHSATQLSTGEVVPTAAIGTGFVSVATGNWNTPATWGYSGTPTQGLNYPGPNDNVTKSNTHTVTLTGPVSTTGSVTINGTGSLDMNSNAFTAGNIQGNGNISNTGNASVALTVGGDNSNQTFSGIIGIGAGTVVKNGSGTWTLSGANTYTGATTVNGGTLKAGVATQAFGVTSAVTLANATGVILDITGFNNTIGSLTGGGAGGGNITLGAATLTIGSDNASPAAYAGIISGTGAIIKSGTGSLTLSGANTFSGSKTLTSGTMNINNAQALGTVAGTFIINGGIINNTSGGAITTLSYPQTWGGDFAFTGTNDLNLGTGAVAMSAARQITINGGVLTIGGVISGTGFRLTKAGTGVLTLAGTNVFTGGTTLTAGTLNINNSQALGTVAGTFIINGGIIDNTSGSAITTLNYPQTWGGDVTFTGTNDLNFGTGAITLSAARMVTTSGGLLTEGGIISGGFRLTKAGAGTLTLSGVNTYTGTTMAAGTLNINNSQALGVVGGTFIINGGVIDNTSGAALTTLNYPQTWGGDFAFNGTYNLNLGTGAAAMSAARQINVNGGILTVGGVISGAGYRLTKAGSGALTLSGTNTFTGGTTLTTGTLNINSSQALGTVAGTFIVNGGTIDNTTAAAISTLNYPQTWNSDFTFTGTQNLNLGTGTVAMGANCQLTATAGVLTVSGIISGAGYNLTKAGAGTLSFGTNVVSLGGLNISTGTLISTSGTMNLTGDFVCSSTFTHNSGTVNFNGTDQLVAGVTYYNLTISNGGTKTLQTSATVNRTLTLNAGILQLSNYNLNINYDVAAAITGGTFSSTNMIATDGTGYLIKNATTAQTLYPIGGGGYYSPATLVITAGGTTGTVSVRAVSTAALGVNFVKKYWDVLTSTGSKTITATFTYDPSEGNSATSAYFKPTAGLWQTPPPTGTPSFGATYLTITGTTSITTTSTFWTAGVPASYYSYKTGSWSDPATWTSDPGGTTQVGSTIPGSSDIVEILPGRTVALTSNVASSSLILTIDAGGSLDLSTYQFTAGLNTLAGQGTLIISSSPAIFPSPITTNTFINTGGGTTEYRTNSNLPSQATYNNLNINKSGSILTQNISALKLNGDLHVISGTFQINDNTSQRVQLTVNGNVTVDAGAFIKVGTGVTNSTTNPLNIVGGTAPFINYYDQQSHRIVLNGNFTNNGTVRFTNLAYPVYNAFPPTSGLTAGFATVYFQGASDNTLLCNGTTDFYNLVLDKGTDQTYKLTVYSSASSYSNFRLFGANNAGGDAGGANPNLKKALWIRTGTMVLQGLVVIPSLSEGTNAGETPVANPTSEYIIPANGALVLDGVDVVVQTTADDYQEVNAAYTVNGGSGLVNGVSQGVGNALVLYGKLVVNNGFLSTKESAGIITTNLASAPGSFILTNGTVDTKQFYSQAGGAASFQQNGGRLILRGRFQRTPSAFTAVSNLANAPINTVRANDACLAGASGTFSMNNTTNIFTMTGGSMEIYDVCKNTSPSIAFEENSSPSNMSVTGGTIQFIPTTGTNLADVAIHTVSSTAPFNNLTVNRPSSSTTVQLGTAINVLGDLTLTSCVFSANNLDVTVGGNLTIGNGSTYTSGTNTTTFTGSWPKTFTNNGTINPSLNNWVINKPGDILTLAGSGAFTCSNLLTIAAGTLSDGGNTITINKNISNSGVHASTGLGKMVLSGGAAQHIISGSGNGQFGNLELNDAFGASFSSDQQINGSLTMTTGILDIGIYKLNLVGTLSPNDITSYSSAKMIQMAGNDSDDGLVRTISGNGTVYFPIGTNANAVTRYTPAYATLSSVVGTGTLQINVADKELATLAQPAGSALSYYWRARYTGFTGSPTVNYQFTGVDYDDYDAGATLSGYNVAVVPGKVISSSPYTRSSESTTDITGFKINFNGAGAGFPLENASYTAGLPSKFVGTPTVFYTNSNYGTWNSGAIWHQGTKAGATGTVPTTGSIVHIYSDGVSNGRVWADGMVNVPAEINFDQDYSPALTPTTENISRLQFRTAGAFNLGNVKGTGMVSFGIAGIALSGDFGDFGTNLNSFYLFFAGPASVNNIPKPIPNLMVEYSTSINQNITINNDFIIQGSSTVVPLQNITINRDLVLGYWQGGTLQFPAAPSSALTVLVGRNIDYTEISDPTGTRNIIVENTASAFEHRLIVNGNIIHGARNTDVLSLYNTGQPTRTRVILELGGTGANSYSRTSTSIPNLYRLVVNKGSDQISSFTFPQHFIINGSTNSSPKALELQNGTLNLNNATFNLAFTTGGANFNIPSTSGLNLQAGTFAATGGSGISLDGTLQISGGTLNMSGGDNMIEYSASGKANIIVSSGTLTVGSQIRRSPIATDGVLQYNQSGGTVIVGASAAPTSNRGVFEVLNTGSDFTFTGGSLTIRRAQTGTPTIASLYLDPKTSNIATGSVINFGDASTPAAQEIGIYSTIPLQTLTINSTNSPVVKMWIGPLTLNGDLNINSTAGLNANGLDLILKGNFANNGTYTYQQNLTSFSGGAQSLSGTSVTNFYDLTLSPVTSLTINNNNTNTVNNNLTLSSGTLICGSNTVSVKGNLINNANYNNNSGSGGVLLSGTRLQQISGTGTFGQLELNNVFGASVNNNITIQDNLIMTSGILDINTTLLSLGQSSSIIMNGTPYSSTKMISTDGVWSNVGVLKNFTSPYSGTFIFPIGTGGKYTPVVLTVNSNGHAGSIRVNNINRSHPAVVDKNNVLRYYWEVESIGLIGFTGNILLNYLSSDVIGGPESSYVAAELLSPGINWSKATTGPSTDNVNETNHTITFNYNNSSNLTGEYTAGNDDAIPATIPQYTSNANGNWTDKTIWTPSGGTVTPCPDGGPNGFIVTINHVVTANANYCFSYKTNINNTLKAVSPYYGNNFGTISGTNGTLYVESSAFPAGRYDAFIDCASNNTIEYGGTGTYSVNADLYSSVPNVTFSGSGSRTLPDKDLIICRRLLINGPTLDNSLYNRKLTIQGNMILTTGAFNSGTGSNATISFAGSLAQTLGNFTGISSLNNLEINNSLGLTLNGSVDVSNNLILTNGLITTSAINKLTIANTSTTCVLPDGGSSTSYINGPLIKKINQGDPSFRFPIGKKTGGLGSKLSIRATQSGTLLWTAEYFNPDTFSSYLTPLTGVNTKEYWAVSGVPAGSMAFVELGWDPVSDLTPLMTQNGLSDMRVAQYNGTDWTEDNSGTTGGSNNYNGSVETTNRATFASGTGNDFTIGCVNSPKPRVRMTPAGPVCGTAGIPVSLTSSLTIFTPFTVYYTENGTAKSITPASFPATIPTIASGATYILTGFTYNYPSGTLKTGVVDATPVVVNQVPTTATVGAPISLCGGSSVASLTGNDPVVGSGLWTIISGAGGNVASPTVFNSSFTGTNGSSYTLRWTISSGTCTSSADLSISFPLLPVQPGNFTVSSSSVCQGQSGVIFTVPNDPTVTYNWAYSGTGQTITGSSNSVTIGFSVSATSGDLSVTATNGCGTSTARTIVITVISGRIWTGFIGTNWNDAGNWSCDLLPDQTTNVEIPNVTNKPVLSSGNTGYVNNLVVDVGSSLTVAGNFQVSGTVSNSGTLDATGGTVVIAGSAPQTLGTLFSSNKIKNLTINNPAGVTLLDTVKVTGIVLVSNGTLASNGYLVLLSSASGTALIDGSGAGNVTGNVKMQRYLADGFGYKYFSSPMSGVTVAQFGDDMMALTTTTLYKYVEDRPASGWVSYSKPDSLIRLLRGYAVNFGSSHVSRTVDVTGPVYNDNVGITLKNNGRPVTKGFHLVGNPYPSPVDWAIVSPGNTNIDNGVYFFSASADQYGGVYSSYVNGESLGGTNLNIIQSMQGFFVHVSNATTGVLRMTNADRVVNFNQQFVAKKGGLKTMYAMGGSHARLRLTLRYSDDMVYADPMLFYIDDKGTPEFDGTVDALKLLNTDLQMPNIYSVAADGTIMSINAISPITEDFINLPLGIKLNRTAGGTVIFKLEEIDPSLTGMRVFLTDITAGVEQDLLTNQEYTITLPKGEYLNRFYLNFSNTTTSNREVETEQNIFKVYSTGGILKAEVNRILGDYGIITVFNISGQKLFSEKIYNTGYHEFNTIFKEGIYIVNYSTGSYAGSRKLFILGR